MEEQLEHVSEPLKPTETQTQNVNSTENEYDLRRRRIAKVFMDAYGGDILKYRKMDPKKLEEMQKKRDEEEEARVTSPYNIQTVFWILASIAIFKLTDFVPAMFYDSAVKKTWLYIGAGFIGINMAIALYLIIVCSWIRKITDWEKHSPSAVPIATCSFVSGTLCINIALWPVYGFLTPVLLFTLFMGFIVIVSLLPNSIAS
ncbi:transmembrane protein 128 isoform X2 [Strongylocentrotus purpuratus]|uniref:Transmembrane protein 128 n=1 Tax=Strongylocentrotus purpuratus TaxID=7668 RepID=A0A7M7NT50_STRPU|nr:transmembrane protein 128 isoform X2 [Strongylocentrotus purpuratus]